MSDDWPQSVFEITWVYALTYIGNSTDYNIPEFCLPYERKEETNFFRLEWKF